MKLWQLSRPVAGILLTHGLPGATVIAILGLLASPPRVNWAFVLGWLAGTLLLGVTWRGRSSPLPVDLPEHAQLRTLQAVHDGPIVEDVEVARGVVSYLRQQPWTARRGPGWLWVCVWLALSGVMVLLVGNLMAGASPVRVVLAHTIVLGLITIGVASEWRLRTRAQTAEAAAMRLLTTET